MKDLFKDYYDYSEEYSLKKDLYDKSMLYQCEILEDSYHNILELQPGNDSICLDYITFGEYTRLVSSQFVSIFRDFMNELQALKSEYECAFNLKEAVKTRIKLFANISYYDLIRLLQLYNVKFEIVGRVINVYVGEDVYNIIVSNDYSLVDDDCNISLFLRQILDEDACDFIKFYINYQASIMSRCVIDEAYAKYFEEKRACIIH